ncbi:hypothetical protein ES332_A13G147400v1 [Gossypium tomentosum]|uniref:Uncharacterized protein n=1 Tax=Gossypium tomentosum TaxID=34277 RepID=A0A5D2MMK5_GOSTO|nr:hypothetical protein ES332_A13G147400v1 [Gossypium tomentosum]
MPKCPLFIPLLNANLNLRVKTLKKRRKGSTHVSLTSRTPILKPKWNPKEVSKSFTIEEISDDDARKKRVMAAVRIERG